VISKEAALSFRKRGFFGFNFINRGFSIRIVWKDVGQQGLL
jgi:hypothetical protein